MICCSLVGAILANLWTLIGLRRRPAIACAAQRRRPVLAAALLGTAEVGLLAAGGHAWLAGWPFEAICRVTLP